VALLKLMGNPSSELEVFQRLGRHRHLMQLRATTTDPKGMFCFLQDYMRHGSLHDALSSMADDGRALPYAVLMRIAMQVRQLALHSTLKL
jgi:hypothetical protein